MPDPWKPELGHCIRDRWQFLLCTVRIYITSECHLEPWPVWLECHPTSKGVRVPLQIRALAWVVGSIPSPQSRCGWLATIRSFSLASLSTSLSLALPTFLSGKAMKNKCPWVRIKKRSQRKAQKSCHHRTWNRTLLYLSSATASHRPLTCGVLDREQRTGTEALVLCSRTCASE